MRLLCGAGLVAAGIWCMVTPLMAAPRPVVVDEPAVPEVRTVAEGLDLPWGLAFLPDGSALVTERDSARLLHVTTEGQVDEVATIEEVQEGGEGGLLGVAVSPDYETDRHVFLYYSTASDNRIVRATYEDGQLGEQEAIVEGIPYNETRHNGGRLAFGPDGMLYATTGDAEDAEAAQDTSSLAGKILRMTHDGQPAEGNPIEGSLVWSHGHRNVQGLAWDPADRLYASELGESSWDEINLIEAGRNYGWPTHEGPADGGGSTEGEPGEGSAGESGEASTDGGEPGGGETGDAPTGEGESGEGFVDPVVTWQPADASPSDAAFLDGHLYVAALRGSRLWRVPVHEDGSTGEPQSLLEGDHGRLRAVEPSPDGGLWVTTSNGSASDQILALTFPDAGTEGEGATPLNGEGGGDAPASSQDTMVIEAEMEEVPTSTGETMVIEAEMEEVPTSTGETMVIEAEMEEVPTSTGQTMVIEAEMEEVSPTTTNDTTGDQDCPPPGATEPHLCPAGASVADPSSEQPSGGEPLEIETDVELSPTTTTTPPPCSTTTTSSPSPEDESSTTTSPESTTPTDDAGDPGSTGDTGPDGTDDTDNPDGTDPGSTDTGDTDGSDGSGSTTVPPCATTSTTIPTTTTTAPPACPTDPADTGSSTTSAPAGSDTPPPDGETTSPQDGAGAGTPPPDGDTTSPPDGDTTSASDAGIQPFAGDGRDGGGDRHGQEDQDRPEHEGSSTTISSSTSSTTSSTTSPTTPTTTAPPCPTTTTAPALQTPSTPPPAPTTTAAPPPEETLPRTGSNTGRLVALGVGLLLAGGLLVLSAQRYGSGLAAAAPAGPAIPPLPPAEPLRRSVSTGASTIFETWKKTRFGR